MNSVSPARSLRYWQSSGVGEQVAVALGVDVAGELEDRDLAAVLDAAVDDAPGSPRPAGRTAARSCSGRARLAVGGAEAHLDRERRDRDRRRGRRGRRGADRRRRGPAASRRTSTGRPSARLVVVGRPGRRRPSWPSSSSWPSAARRARTGPWPRPGRDGACGGRRRRLVGRGETNVAGSGRPAWRSPALAGGGGLRLLGQHQRHGHQRADQQQRDGPELAPDERRRCR